MRKLQRLALLLLAGAFLLCLSLPFLPYLWRVQSLALAKQRWARHGAASYTIIVTRACFCPDVGEYKLSVHNGQVVAVESLTNPFGPPNPSPRLSDFDGLTVEAMFANAVPTPRDSWRAPWLVTREVSYDPTYGYVRRFASDENGVLSRTLGRWVFDAQYFYTARDLQVNNP
ncbi:MAG: DUF6174 domain-containing protein [Anaerolineales bacterium]